MVTKTLDELRMSPVNPLSELMMCGKLSHRVLCDLGGGGGYQYFAPSGDDVWIGLSMDEPVFVCFPRWMDCCHPGAADYY